MEPIYHSWLGLPHVIGADPRDGEGACCLVMAKLLLEDAGFKMPPIDAWIEMAKKGAWDPLRDAFYRNTTPVEYPIVWSLTLLDNPEGGLGLGTVIPHRMLLAPIHDRGVTALPLFSLPSDLEFHKVIEHA